MKQTELITVPTFTFNQQDAEKDVWEEPISVDFYNGTICLRQNGNYDEQENINISVEYFEALFKAIRKYKPIAEDILAKR